MWNATVGGLENGSAIESYGDMLSMGGVVTTAPDSLGFPGSNLREQLGPLGLIRALQGGCGLSIVEVQVIGT